MWPGGSRRRSQPCGTWIVGLRPREGLVRGACRCPSKHTIIWILAPLQTRCCFSLVVFRIFLSSVFSSFIIMCLGVHFFGFILLGICPIS